MLTVELVRKKAAAPFTKNSEHDLEKLLTSLPELFSKNAFQPIGGEALPGDSILLEPIKKSPHGQMHMEMRQDDFVSVVEKNLGKHALPEGGIRTALESPFVEETINTGAATHTNQSAKNKTTPNNNTNTRNAKELAATNGQQKPAAPVAKPTPAAPLAATAPAQPIVAAVEVPQTEENQKGQEWPGESVAVDQPVQETDDQIQTFEEQGLGEYAEETGDWYGGHPPNDPYAMHGGYYPPNTGNYQMPYGGGMHSNYYYPSHGGHYQPPHGMAPMMIPASGMQGGGSGGQAPGVSSPANPGTRKPLKISKGSQGNLVLPAGTSGSAPGLGGQEEQVGGEEFRAGQGEGQRESGVEKGEEGSKEKSGGSGAAKGQVNGGKASIPGDDTDNLAMAQQANLMKSAPITEDLVGVEPGLQSEFAEWNPAHHPGVQYPDSGYGYDGYYGYDYGGETDEMGAPKYYPPNTMHGHQGYYYNNYPPNGEMDPYNYSQRHAPLGPGHPHHPHDPMMGQMDPYMQQGMWGYNQEPGYEYMQPGGHHPHYGGYGYDYHNVDPTIARMDHESLDPHMMQAGQAGPNGRNNAQKRGGKSNQGNNQASQGQGKKPKDLQQTQPGQSNMAMGAGRVSNPQQKGPNPGSQAPGAGNKKGSNSKIPAVNPGMGGGVAGTAQRRSNQQLGSGNGQQGSFGNGNMGPGNGGVGNNRALPQNGQVAPNKKRNGPQNQVGPNQSGGPPMPTSLSNLDNIQQTQAQNGPQAKRAKKDPNPAGLNGKGNSSEEQLPRQNSSRNAPEYDYSIPAQVQNSRKNNSQNQMPGQPFNGNTTTQNQKPNNQRGQNHQQGPFQNPGPQNTQGGASPSKKLASPNQNPYMPNFNNSQSQNHPGQGAGNQPNAGNNKKIANKNNPGPNPRQHSEDYDDEDDFEGSWDAQNEGQSSNSKKNKPQVYFVKK